MKRLNILIALFLVVLLGCEEKTLDKPPRDFFSEEDVWTDFGMIQQFENAIYEGLDSWWVRNHSSSMLGSYTSDGFSAENLGDIYNINAGNIAPDRMGALDIWSFKYDYIRRCNIFLSRIDDVEVGTEDEKNTLKGEVKFLRAKFYFDLIKNYGGVPLITNVFELNDDFQVPRNGFEEMVDWIMKEMDEAKTLLPEVRPDNEWGRIDQGICTAIQAKVLLYANSELHKPGVDPSGEFYDYSKNTWQECADLAKAVIDMPQFELQTFTDWQEYADMLNHPGPEIIFPKIYSTEFKLSGTSINMVNGMPALSGWMETQVSQDLVQEFEMTNGLLPTDPASGFDDSPEKYYEDRDMRFYADVDFRGRTWQGEKWFLVYPDSRDVTLKFTTTGYPLRKFKDESIDITFDPQVFPFLRLADVYLIYAEALYELNEDPAEVRKWVNEVRNRVGQPDLNNSLRGEALLKAIQHERRIELCFENNRFFDVRRWKIAEDTENKPIQGIRWTKINTGGSAEDPSNLTYELADYSNRVFDKKFYYLPIPRVEMERTDLLEQNAYYEP